jgi:hypothetical protein
MPRFKVTFHRAIQDSQEFGSNDEHMVSRVFFTLAVDGKLAGDFFADLKQTVGSKFNRSDIEVSPPRGYDGPFDHVRFSDAARDYFSGAFGLEASGFNFGGSTNIRMWNNLSGQEREYEF